MIKNLLRYISDFCRPKLSVNVQIVETSKQLEGNVALVTGGTSGIGKAIAKSFVEAGAFVIITGRNEEHAACVAAEIANSSRIIGLKLNNLDITSFSSTIHELIQVKLPKNLKKIDILVNNAGVIGGDIRNSSEHEFDKVISTNLKSVFFLNKIVADLMIKNNIKGNILNIASSSSLRPAISAYTLSKWGIRGLTKGMAKLLAPYGITVNGLAPGPTATKMLGKIDYSDIELKSIPLGRYILPEEIAAMALFLCGPQGKSIIGDTIYMTGGAGIIDNSDMNYHYVPNK